MTAFNRILYVVCITCAVLLAVLILAAIWGNINTEMMWKMMGSVLVAMLASGFVLAVNLNLQKAKSEKQEAPK